MKNVIAIIIFFTSILSLHSQNYVKLADVSGVKISANDISELNEAADALVAAMPTEFQGQFKVYDMGFYVYNELMVGLSIPAVWDNALANVSSPYYLAFGRESDQNGNFNQMRVVLKLPKTGAFQCLDETYLEIIKNSVKLPAQTLLKNGVAAGVFNAFTEAERTSMSNLKTYVTKIKNCCNNGVWNPGCGTCRYDFNEIKSMLSSRKYMRMESSNTTITSYTYSSIQSAKKIVLEIQGEIINYTDNLQTIANENGGQTKIVVREINNTSCDQANNFQEIAPDQPYTEDIVIVNFDGHVEVFTKITASTSARQILPWLAVEVLKRVAMAAVGAVFEIGLSFIIEYYFEEHTTYQSAWDATKIDWYEVAASAAEGAFSEAKYATIIITATKEVVKWVINTPYSSYAKGGWEEDSREGAAWFVKFSGKVVAEVGKSAVTELAGKRALKLGQHVVNSKAGKKLTTALADKLIALIKKRPSLLFKWKKLGAIAPSFSSTGKHLDDPDFVEKLMDAADPDIHKLTLQRGLGKHVGDSKTLGDNLKKLGKGPAANCISCEAHHIIPGGESSDAAIKLREKLKKHGIDLNEATNGVYLPKSLHSPTFIPDYEKAVLARLSKINNQAALRIEMLEIGKDLAAGKKFW